MTPILSEALGDLADDVGHPSPAPDLVATAWSRGRRRRQRVRMARASLAVVAALAVAATVLPGSWDRAALPAGPADSAALGHPVRIAKPWRISPLPQRGEPLAGIALSSTDLATGDWYAVTQDGDLHSLPVRSSFMQGVVPSLSADGRLLGYLDSADDRYRIRDVVTGRITVFPDVGPESSTEGTRAQPRTQPRTQPPAHRAAVQTPGYFSPDGSHVVISGSISGSSTGAGDATPKLVLGADGSVRSLGDGGQYDLVGWLDDRTVLAMDSTTSEPGDDLSTTLTPVALGLDGTTRRLPTLAPSTPVVGFGFSQWSPALSPDRRSLAIGLGGTQHVPQGGTTVLVFDLATGRELDHVDITTPFATSTTAATAGLKHVEWRGSTWYGVPPGESVTALTPRTAGGDPAVVVDPRLELGWLDLADDALAGPPHGTLLGTRTGWEAWHWRELLLGAAAVAVLGLAWRRLSRRAGPAPARRRAA